MIGSILGGYAASKAGGVIDNALGRPFDLWTAQVNAANAAAVRKDGYEGNARIANALPSPEALYAMYRRGLLSDTDAVQTLSTWGVAPNAQMLAGCDPVIRNIFNGLNTLPAPHRSFFGALWSNAAYMTMSRPAPGEIASLLYRKRLTPANFEFLAMKLDANWDMYERAVEAQFAAPDYGFLLQLRRLGRISAADYALWSARVGWTNAAARELAEKGSTIPTLGEAFLASWRGAITPAEFAAYRRAHGYLNETDWNAVQSANRPMPGPSDLVRFAVREVWDNATVAAWGFDEDFPPEFAGAMKWQGLDWGLSVPLPGGGMSPEVTWPQAYWRAHWQLMSPTQAYEAFRRLRGTRLERYAARFPGLTPFTRDDLMRVLKVSDYPPAMRNWLAAISTQPMRLSDIRNGYLRGTMPPQEAQDQLQDRGYILPDSQMAMRTWRAQEEYAEQAPMRALRRNVFTRAVNEILASYRASAIPKMWAQDQLQVLGIDVPLALRLLAIEDARIAREDITEALRYLRTAWFQGQLTADALQQGLEQAGLDARAVARFRRKWTLQRGLRRRMLSTSQVLAGVAAGALPTAVAALSLANLGWSAPDREFLLQGAVARLALLQARGIARVAQQQKASQREKVRALRQVEAAQRRLRAELRTTTPLTALRRWLLLGIRSAPWVRQRLLLLGYDIPSSDAYLSQWVMENQRAPHPTAPAAEGTAKLLKRQTPLGTLKRWWQNGVASNQWIANRMRSLGYTGESINGYIREWTRTLGKKPGPIGGSPEQSVFASEQPPAGAPSQGPGPAP